MSKSDKFRIGRGGHQNLITFIIATSTGKEIMDWKLDDNFFLDLFKAWIRFFQNSIYRNV